MLELTKTSTTGKYVEISVKIPAEEGTDAISEHIFAHTRALLQTLGHEIREITTTAEDEKLYTFAEAFPDSSPARRLRGLRVREALTQKALAVQVGIKPHHISEMESGKRPISREMAKRLIAALGGDYRVLL